MLDGFIVEVLVHLLGISKKLFVLLEYILVIKGTHPRETKFMKHSLLVLPITIHILGRCV